MCSVSLLCFRRFRGFADVLLGSPELKAVREGLQAVGLSADLSTLPGFGAAKLLVEADVAHLALRAVQQVRLEMGEPLGARHVIVSRASRKLVLNIVKTRGHRGSSNTVLWELPLLGAWGGLVVRVRNTFIETLLPGEEQGGCRPRSLPL